MTTKRVEIGVYRATDEAAFEVFAPERNKNKLKHNLEIGEYDIVLVKRAKSYAKERGRRS